MFFKWQFKINDISNRAVLTAFMFGKITLPCRDHEPQIKRVNVLNILPY